MSDITTHYGGSILAMVGKNCFSIVNDYRLGNGFITVSKHMQRIHQITPKTYVGLGGFLPDCQHILGKINKNVSLFRLDEGREIEPKELANLLSSLLYAHRRSPMYISVIVVGLDSKDTPYICEMDCLGCKTEPGSFVAVGTAEPNLMGICEALYRENMDSEDLFTTSVQGFLNAVDRDALSGWGAECVIVEPSKKICRTVKGRCD